MPRQSSRPPSHLSRHPVALTALAVVLALGPTACGSDDDASPPSTTSGPPATTLVGSTVPPPRALLDDQTAPQTINGRVVDGDTLWIASIADDLVLQVDRESGAILARFPGGGAGPDDVAVAPDGTVYSTGFLNGDVGRIADGEYSVLVTLVSGINPITVGDDGTIWVGEMADGGDLTRIEPDGTTEVVATGLPTIFWFDNYEGGLGAAEKIYTLIMRLLETGLEAVESCTCTIQGEGVQLGGVARALAAGG